MRALVTGATGFIGSHLIAALRLRGIETVCLSRRPVSSRYSDITVTLGDLGNPDSLDAATADLNSIDVVFHLGAALPSQQLTPAEFLTVNGNATEHLLRVARRLGAESFVYLSSLSILGKPVILPVTEKHPVAAAPGYPASKLAGERVCEIARCDGAIAATSLRITSPYGLGMPDTVLAQFVRKALASETLAWHGQGLRTQDFVAVADVVSACILAAGASRPGIYNIGSGRSTTMRALAEMIAAETGAKAAPSGNPDPQEGVDWRVDISAARSALGYVPENDPREGIPAYVAALRASETLDFWWENPP
jgi:UDP-glucose 4-epimerase